MDPFKNVYQSLPGILPVLVVIVATIAVMWLVRRFLFGHVASSEGRNFSRQVTLMGIGAAGVVMGIIALPASEDTRLELLRLLGLIVSAVIAFSSTTMISNAMAGAMLRAVRSFRAGDFMRVGEHFGRVTERGLFHTEIQSTNRDLITLPNLYLVSNPVTVVRSSGTVVSAEVSIGYDVSHDRIEALLVEAAAETQLDEPFVQILELGSFAVSYRVAGFRKDIRYIVSAGTLLRRAILDKLHAAGVEIATPTLMAQRPVATSERFIPRTKSRTRRATEPEVAPEDRVFDKADEAEMISGLRHERARLEERIKELHAALKKAEESQRGEFDAELSVCEARIREIAAELE